MRRVSVRWYLDPPTGVSNTLLALHDARWLMLYESAREKTIARKKANSFQPVPQRTALPSQGAPKILAHPPLFHPRPPLAFSLGRTRQATPTILRGIEKQAARRFLGTRSESFWKKTVSEELDGQRPQAAAGGQEDRSTAEGGGKARPIELRFNIRWGSTTGRRRPRASSSICGPS